MEPFDVSALGRLIPEEAPARNELVLPIIHPHGPGWEQLPLFEDNGV